MAFIEDVLLFSHVVRICHILRQHLHRCCVEACRDHHKSTETSYNDNNVDFKAVVPNLLGFWPLKMYVKSLIRPLITGYGHKLSSSTNKVGFF